MPMPEFATLVNHTFSNNPFKSSNNSNSTSKPINLLLLNGFTISKRNVSIHYHIQPDDESLGYFAAFKFGGNPYLNKTYQRYDIWNIFCPWSKIF